MNARESYVARLRENIPPKLLELAVWLLWTGDLKRKLPVYVNGSVRADGIPLDSPEDRAQLATFDEAAIAYLQGNYLGIGAALGEVPGEEIVLCGIDLDDCYTDGQLDERALEILAAADSYAERSPSGQGLKIFGVGNIGTEKIPSSNTTPGLEIYSGARYFTTTGERLNGAHLNDLHDAAVLARKLLAPKRRENSSAKAAEARNPILEALALQGLYLRPGKGGKHLIRCPWESRHTPNERGERQTSNSEAAYFEPGSSIGERVFAHGYFKCQHAHCADRGLPELREFLGVPVTSQGDSNVNETIDYNTRATTFTVEQLQTQPSPRKFTVRPWLPQGCTTVVGGPGGAGKSSLLLELGTHVCRDLPFYNMDVDPGDVVVITKEDSATDYLGKLYELGVRRLYSEGDYSAVAARFHVLDLRGTTFRLLEPHFGAVRVTAESSRIAEHIRSDLAQHKTRPDRDREPGGLGRREG